MEKYEYKVLQMVDEFNIEKELNKMAEQGWRFKSIVEDEPYYIILLYLKEKAMLDYSDYDMDKREMINMTKINCYNMYNYAKLSW